MIVHSVLFTQGEDSTALNARIKDDDVFQALLRGGYTVASASFGQTAKPNTAALHVILTAPPVGTVARFTADSSMTLLLFCTVLATSIGASVLASVLFQ